MSDFISEYKAVFGQWAASAEQHTNALAQAIPSFPEADVHWKNLKKINGPIAFGIGPIPEADKLGIGIAYHEIFPRTAELSSEKLQYFAALMAGHFAAWAIQQDVRHKFAFAVINADKTSVIFWAGKELDDVQFSHSLTPGVTGGGEFQA